MIKMQPESTQFIFPIQGAANLRELNQMREDGTLTDVTIVTEHREFQCHRAVLAASCPYFKAMFSRGLRECFEQTVTLHGVKPVVMEMILQYAYTGMCIISKGLAAELLTASDLFGLLPLRDAAANFLCKCIDVNTCLKIRRLADEHSCEKVYKTATEFSQKHFSDIVRQEEFLSLGVAEVVRYLADNDLCVTTEDVVFDAAMRWIRHDPDGRSKHVEQVLEQVRLPFVKPEYLKLQATVDPLIYHNKTCVRQVLEARIFQISGEFKNHFDMRQRKPRKCTSKEVMMILGGETRVGSFQEQVREISYYEPMTSQWKSLPTTIGTEQVKAFSVASMECQVYLTGGTVNNKAISDVRVFYTYLNKWFKQESMNAPRYHHGCCAVDGILYVIGGTDGRQCLSSSECFDPSTNSWRETKPLRHAVKCPAVTSLHRKLYVFGGFTDQYTICQNIQMYSVECGDWSVVTTQCIDYTCAKAAELNSVIYLLGGSSKTVKAFDTETNSIHRVADMLQKRDNCGLAAVNGKLFVTGGVSESTGPSLDGTECYCPLQDKWEAMEKMPRRLYRHGSLCVRIPIYHQDTKTSSDNATTQNNPGDSLMGIT